MEFILTCCLIKIIHNLSDIFDIKSTASIITKIIIFTIWAWDCVNSWTDFINFQHQTKVYTRLYVHFISLTNPKFQNLFIMYMKIGIIAKPILLILSNRIHYQLKKISTDILFFIHRYFIPQTSFGAYDLIFATWGLKLYTPISTNFRIWLPQVKSPNSIKFKFDIFSLSNRNASIKCTWNRMHLLIYAINRVNKYCYLCLK